MANPVLIKAAVMLLTDKRTWKAIGVVIAAVLTPFILIIIMVGAMLYGTASHNNAAVELTFYGGSIPITMPGEYRDYITEMRSCFSSLDEAIAAVEEMMEDGDSLDSNRIKAVFYALNFGTENLSLRRAKAREFVDCFVEYRDCTHTWTDEDGVNTVIPIPEPIPSMIFPPFTPMYPQRLGGRSHRMTWLTSPKSICGWCTVILM